MVPRSSRVPDRGSATSRRQRASPARDLACSASSGPTPGTWAGRSPRPSSVSAATTTWTSAREANRSGGGSATRRVATGPAPPRRSSSRSSPVSRTVAASARSWARVRVSVRPSPSTPPASAREATRLTHSHTAAASRAGRSRVRRRHPGSGEGPSATSRSPRPTVARRAAQPGWRRSASASRRWRSWRTLARGACCTASAWSRSRVAGSTSRVTAETSRAWARSTTPSARASATSGRSRSRRRARPTARDAAVAVLVGPEDLPVQGGDRVEPAGVAERGQTPPGHHALAALARRQRPAGEVDQRGQQLRSRGCGERRGHLLAQEPLVRYVDVGAVRTGRAARWAADTVTGR